MYFVSSQNSPKLFCPKNRSFDIDAIYSVIDDAKQYVYIAVMDYLPISSTSTKRSVSVFLEPGLQGKARNWEPQEKHPGHWDALKSQKVACSHLSVYLQLTQNASPPSVHFKDSGSHPINYYLSNLPYKHDSNFRLKIGLWFENYLEK